MVRHWSVIRPLIEAAAPRTIVEIGVRGGGTTKRLLEHARGGEAVVHGIDPAPDAVVQELVESHPGRFFLHRALSLEALPEITGVDCALIDGDHNWYTVLNELRLLARQSAQPPVFPLTFAHDVGWPYGRRDLYYAPETIPEEYRQPHRRGGLVPGQSALEERSGLSPGLYHAESEGGPRNGVLTALQDFVAESRRPLTLKVVPGFAGLGVLVDGEVTRANAGLAERLAALDSPEFLRRECQRLEDARNRLRARAVTPPAR